MKRTYVALKKEERTDHQLHWQRSALKHYHHSSVLQNDKQH